MLVLRQSRLAGACAVQKHLALMRAKLESPFEELLSDFVGFSIPCVW